MHFYIRFMSFLLACFYNTVLMQQHIFMHDFGPILTVSLVVDLLLYTFPKKHDAKPVSEHFCAYLGTPNALKLHLEKVPLGFYCFFPQYYICPTLFSVQICEQTHFKNAYLAGHKTTSCVSLEYKIIW